MSCEFRHGKVLKQIVDAVSELCTDLNFYFSPDGLSMQTMDPSHATLMLLEIPASGFESWEFGETLPPVGVNANSLNKILSCMKDDLTVKLIVTDSTLEIILGTLGEFSLGQIDIDADLLQPQDFDYQHIEMVKSQDYGSIIGNLQKFGDTAKITFLGSVIRWATNGDIGKASFNMYIESDEERKMDIVSDEFSDVQLSLRHLSMYSKVCPISNTIIIKFADPGLPVQFTFNVEKVPEVKLNYWLAPRCDDELS